ncbi:hypothetical protein B0T14DRAFT_568220 [Immersiella caudata]|uniref:RING-type domain-containing protein n=1 Tax=Immersiella caudata TaxID=314043 RepID=A0AA39WJQ6_9PEZI|nr:hypothetical protein B0T14DRAFT_568220 [Immersiella caudata]
MVARVVPRFIEDFAVWHQVKNRILNPNPNSDARVVCDICKDTQLTIVGISSSLASAIDREGPGIVTPCGHMFCADCWKNHEANTKDWEENVSVDDDRDEDRYACPKCREDLHFPACLCPYGVNKLPTAVDYQRFVEENGPVSLAVFLQGEVALTLLELDANQQGRPERCFTCFHMQFGQFVELFEYLVSNPHLSSRAVAAYFKSASSSAYSALAVIVHAHNIHRNLLGALNTTATVVDLKFPGCPPTHTLRMMMGSFPRGDDGWVFCVELIDDASGVSVEGAPVYLAVPTDVVDPCHILTALPFSG